LAIIKTKLEILLDSQNMSEDQVRLIESAYQATNKLSRLGKTLALLTRIENLEFAELQAIDFKQILDNNLNIFEELIDYKQLTVNISGAESVLVNINPALADMLLGNLLKNAIKHNIEGGQIQIELNTHKLVISNTGQVLKMVPENLFARFQKDNPASDSLGLGLAIVKKICEVNHFTIQYDHFENIHQITLHFNQAIAQPKSEVQMAI
jgi:signal transduction histidine kinase